MQNKEGEKERKEDRVNIQFSVTSLLNYLAITAAAFGLLYAILSTAGMEHSPGPARAGQFFLGLLYSVVASGFLFALSGLVSSRHKE